MHHAYSVCQTITCHCRCTPLLTTACCALLQVVVYMQRQLLEPVLVYLCQPGPAPCLMHPEIVESHSTLANIMALLQQRKLACRPFPASTAAGAVDAAATAAGGAAARSSTHSSARSSVADTSSAGGSSGGAGSSSAILPSCVVVKRQDGSCCSRVRVTESCSVAQLQATIQQVEVRRTDGHQAAAASTASCAAALMTFLLCIKHACITACSLVFCPTPNSSLSAAGCC
jgi:hypothetical protein